MERLFQILAVILAGIAAYFLWRKNADGAFISAVLGAVCFFISVRFQVKTRVRQRAEEEEIKEQNAVRRNELEAAENEPDFITRGEQMPARDKQRTKL